VLSGTVWDHRSTLVRVRLEGARLRRVAAAEVSSHSQMLFASSAGRSIVLGRGAFLYPSDLGASEEIPFPVSPYPVPRGGAIGESTASSWSVFRVGDFESPVRAGLGFLYSATDDAVIYGMGASIRVETLSGRRVGTLPKPSASMEDFYVEAAGPGRLLVDFNGKLRIFSLETSGRELLSLRPPEGWGFRYGWSDSRGRILFDHFTRTVPMLDRLGDFFNKLLGGPEQPNGESVEVEDTATGGVCFALNSPFNLFGLSGSYHADLSPSGKLVVVSTLSEVSVYMLPRVCDVG
jgi:hypothetical protein